jgi:hypothetical protein
MDSNDGVKVLFAQNKVHDNYCELALWSEAKTIFDPVIYERNGITIK